MSDTKGAVEKPPPPPGRGLAALLSFTAPGLGQIYQGAVYKNPARLAKGILFLVSLWGMFFYGMYLGKGKNVYLPHVQEHLVQQRQPATLMGRQLPPFLGNVYTRLQFAGQFWIGAAAWPALWNYLVPEKPVLVRFYASPGAVPKGEEHRRADSLEEAEKLHNELQRQPDMGKRWDIAWVYTVIAGVLNILVIYDAWAGPVHIRGAEPSEQHKDQKGGAA